MIAATTLSISRFKWLGKGLGWMRCVIQIRRQMLFTVRAVLLGAPQICPRPAYDRPAPIESRRLKASTEMSIGMS